MTVSLKAANRIEARIEICDKLDSLVDAKEKTEVDLKNSVIQRDSLISNKSNQVKDLQKIVSQDSVKFKAETMLLNESDRKRKRNEIQRNIVIVALVIALWASLK